jgi:hypothetical protein
MFTISGKRESQVSPPATVIEPLDSEKMTCEFDWQSIPGESGLFAVIKLSPERRTVTLLPPATNGADAEIVRPSKLRETYAWSTVIEFPEQDYWGVRMAGVGEMTVGRHLTRDASISTSPELMSQII